PAPTLSRVRLSGDGRVSRLVSPLRRPVELGEGLHEHRGARERQRRPRARAVAVRVDVRHRVALRAACGSRARSDRAPPRASLRRGDRPMTPQVLTLTLFLAVVAATVAVTVWASRQTSGANDYYAGGRSFSAFQNGLAIGGDYMSAASFLGISGAIALFGYDGFLYSIGFLVAWLVALLLVAELLRNSGRYTLADQPAYRMTKRPVRMAAATSTVVVSIFYLLAQMVGAGSLIVLLLGVDDVGLQNLVIVGVGLLMIFYVCVGGMKGTTWVQIIKAVLLMTGT